MPILDDHFRRARTLALRDRDDRGTMDGLRHLLPFEFEKLVTYNGCQFGRSNTQVQQLCHERMMKKLIWTSTYHPQTMGKLSAYKKDLKRFLAQMMPDFRDPDEPNP